MSRSDVVSRSSAPDPGDVFHADCFGRRILDHVTSRWASLILLRLAEGPSRFHELRRGIGGISEKMLAQTLRVLQRDGLLDRSVEPARPPKVTYSLTDLGVGVAEPLGALVDWIGEHADRVRTAQDAHDADDRDPQ